MENLYCQSRIGRIAKDFGLAACFLLHWEVCPVAMKKRTPCTVPARSSKVLFGSFGPVDFLDLELLRSQCGSVLDVAACSPVGHGLVRHFHRSQGVSPDCLHLDSLAETPIQHVQCFLTKYALQQPWRSCSQQDTAQVGLRRW